MRHFDHEIGAARSEGVNIRQNDLRRQASQPFGGLLVTGVDWSGPNEAWERESLRRIAAEVMPRLSQHAAARAAE